MTLKEACANSLLMFVAATCVVLIVKALPNGGKSSETPTLAMQEGVKVYYLHSNARCPTCRTIEEYAKEAVETGFADDLKNNRIAWQVVNYQSPGNEHYAIDYNIVSPNVVLVKIKEGKQVAWKGLPEVWEHVGDKAVFVEFVQKSLREFLQSDSATDSPTVPSTKSDAPSPPLLPLPSAETPDSQSPPSPLRDAPDSQSTALPLPE
jgi:hypothetical protein